MLEEGGFACDRERFVRRICRERAQPRPGDGDVSDLPRGWSLTTLGALGPWRSGGTPSKSNASYWHGGAIPWVSPKDMKRPLIGEAQDYLTFEAIRNSATSLIPAGSVLMVTRSGILRHSFPVAVTTRDVAINQDIKAVTPLPGVDARFLAAQLRANAAGILSHCAKSGTTVDSIEFDRLRSFPLCLCPLPEQRRIVAKLDRLTGHIARARQEMRRIAGLVDKYRQAIIAANVGGDLTRGGCGELWPRLKARELFCWVSGKLLPKSRQVAGDIPVYGGNGVAGSHTQSLIDRPTIVVGRVGVHCGNVHLTAGRAWVTDNAIYARDIDPRIDPRFARLVFWQSSLNARSGGTGQPYLNQNALNDIEFHLPPLPEQREIIHRIEAAFLWLDRVGAEQSDALQLLPKFEHAVLAKAFRGELVPQDALDSGQA
jgi:type I restriction enzyme, S subunit